MRSNPLHKYLLVALQEAYSTMDKQTKVEDLKELVNEFVAEREWGQYHNPKDLAIGLVTEASELLDLFRFKSERELEEMLVDSKKRTEIAEELSDVLYFLLIFSHRYNLDLSTELINKLEKNSLKYPVEKAWGSNKKYTEL
jgi:NTP pyrophosphatase (non-canonical NTP hydrolase)